MYKYEFVLISLQVFFHGIYAVPMVQAGREKEIFLLKMQITFWTILLEATLMCHGNTRGNHLALLTSHSAGDFYGFFAFAILCASSD